MIMELGRSQGSLPCSKVFEEAVVGPSMRGWAEQRQMPKLGRYFFDHYFCLKVECFCFQKKYYSLYNISKKYCKQLGTSMQARRFEQSEGANSNIVPSLPRLYGNGNNGMLEHRVLNTAQEKDE